MARRRFHNFSGMVADYDEVIRWLEYYTNKLDSLTQQMAECLKDLENQDFFERHWGEQKLQEFRYEWGDF